MHEQAGRTLKQLSALYLCEYDSRWFQLAGEKYVGAFRRFLLGRTHVYLVYGRRCRVGMFMLSRHFLYALRYRGFLLSRPGTSFCVDKCMAHRSVVEDTSQRPLYLTDAQPGTGHSINWCGGGIGQTCRVVCTRSWGAEGVGAPGRRQHGSGRAARE